MEFSELQKTLQRIGLSTNEAKIYLMLLQEGMNKAGKISKKTQINRTTTYDTLRRLLNKGLVSYVVKANRKYFRVVDPDRLVEFIQHKEDEANKILPILKKMHKKPSQKENVTLYYGYKGMKSIFQDMAKGGKLNRVLDSEGQFDERMPYYAPHFIRKIEKNNIKIRHIIRKGRSLKTKTDTTEVRIMNKKTKSDAVFNIYRDKIAILIWTDPPEGVVIQNKSAADSLRDYFDILWRQAKPANS